MKPMFPMNETKKLNWSRTEHFVEESTEDNDILADVSEKTENSENVDVDAIEAIEGSQIVESSISEEIDPGLSDAEKRADTPENSSPEKTE